MANLPGDYARPFGRLYIAYFDGEVAGCVALRKYSDEKCEMKRLYVREKFRGLKIGKALVEKMVSAAKEMGYNYIILDTLPNYEKCKSIL